MPERKTSIWLKRALLWLSTSRAWCHGLDFYRTRVRSLFTLVTHSLPNSLTDCRLANFIDVTLACEGAVYFATFAYIDADVSDGDRVGIGNSLLQIWNLRFGQDFDVKVWSKDFEYWNLIKI